MNATVNSQILASELRQLCKVVPSKPAIQILSHALLEATVEGALHFHATDLEVRLSTSCQAQVHAPGSVALPAERFLALVEQFADADVNLSLDKHHVGIKCDAFRSRLQALPADDFPMPSAVEGTSSLFDADVLRQLITKVRYAVVPSGPRHALQGALLTLTGASAAMVATDGKRLALATAGRAEGPDQRFIVPMKTLDILLGQADEGSIELTVGSRHLFFSIGGRLLTSRTIDSQFPRYEKIVPKEKENDKRVAINRNVFAAALKRVAVASEESRAVYLGIVPGSMELSSSSPEVGSADETIHIEYDGPPLKICINGDYVYDFLNVASGQTILMLLKDANSAALFTDGDHHVAVVMLMRS